MGTCDLHSGGREVGGSASYSSLSSLASDPVSRQVGV
jgi:hypothetical protein